MRLQAQAVTYRFPPENGTVLRDPLVVLVRKGHGQQEGALLGIVSNVVLVDWGRDRLRTVTTQWLLQSPGGDTSGGAQPFARGRRAAIPHPGGDRTWSLSGITHSQSPSQGLVLGGAHDPMTPFWPMRQEEASGKASSLLKMDFQANSGWWCLAVMPGIAATICDPEEPSTDDIPEPVAPSSAPYPEPGLLWVSH